MSAREYLDKDLYAVLGLKKGADAAEIKKAYRKLARELHPDRNKDNPNAEARFKEISEAYHILGDQARRKEYDEGREPFGARGFRMAPAGAGRPGSTNSFMFNFGGPGGADGGLDDILGGFFGNRRGGMGPRRGADLQTEVTIDFVDAVDGVTVPLRLTREQTCPTCSGSGARPGTSPTVCPTCGGAGQVSRNMGGFAMAEPCTACRGRGSRITDPCQDCAGTGRTMGTQTVATRIPAGVRDGQRIRLRGRGALGAGGGAAGDLVITVHVRPHPVFGRLGDDLILHLPVTFAEATLGAQVKVPTLDGPPVTLRLPAGTANGRTFRLRGRGVPRKDGTGGDLLVTVEVVVPDKLSPAAKDALEKFAVEHAEDPRLGLMQAAAMADR